MLFLFLSLPPPTLFKASSISLALLAQNRLMKKQSGCRLIAPAIIHCYEQEPYLRSLTFPPNICISSPNVCQGQKLTEDIQIR